MCCVEELWKWCDPFRTIHLSANDNECGNGNGNGNMRVCSQWMECEKIKKKCIPLKLGVGDGCVVFKVKMITWIQHQIGCLQLMMNVRNDNNKIKKIKNGNDGGKT
jgi:hypothetical protein